MVGRFSSDRHQRKELLHGSGHHSLIIFGLGVTAHQVVYSCPVKGRQPRPELVNGLLVIVAVSIIKPPKCSIPLQISRDPSNSMIAHAASLALLNLKGRQRTCHPHRPAKVCEDAVEAPVLPRVAHVFFADIRVFDQSVLDTPLIEVTSHNYVRVSVSLLQFQDHVLNVAQTVLSPPNVVPRRYVAPHHQHLPRVPPQASHPHQHLEIVRVRQIKLHHVTHSLVKGNRHAPMGHTPRIHRPIPTYHANTSPILQVSKIPIQ